MNNISEEKLSKVTSQWLIGLFPLISAVISGVALWYTWFRFNTILALADSPWYLWIRPALTGVLGIVFLLATLLFLLGKSSGRSVFKGGLAMVPVILFSNLVIAVVFKLIPSIFNGNAKPFLEHLYTKPLDKAILSVAIIVLLLSLVKAIKSKKQ